VDGNEYARRTVSEPGPSESQVTEADRKSSRSSELKSLSGRVRETESGFVISPADMVVSDQASFIGREAEWYRVSLTLVSDLRREFLILYHVIASLAEAKQSHGRRDCFVAPLLAVTN